MNCSGCNLDISGFSGNIVASNSYGGATRIEFSKLAQDKVTSINADGDLEVILPADTKANLKMSSDRGNVYTDFDLKKAEDKTTDRNSLASITVVGSPSAPAAVRSTGQGRYFVESGAITVNTPDRQLSDRLRLASVSAIKGRRLDHYDYTINDGGVYVSISSYSGNVYLKKK
ncbi:hypothetical protein D9M69_525920 [compost metagenome]